MTEIRSNPIETTMEQPRSIVKIGLLGIAAAALVGAAILVFGATAAPTGILAAGTTDVTLPAAGIDMRGGRGPMDAGRGEGRFGAISITAIAGSNVSLKTADGWTRTVAIPSDATLMKGTATIAITDLKVGDEVRFRQEVQTDGSFKVTELHVVLPHLGGSVTAVTGSSITVTQRDGTSATIKVSPTTTYQIGKTDGKAIGDIKVGMMAGAVGTLNADGTLSATAVHAVDPASLPGFGGRGGHGDRGGFGGHGPMGDNNAPGAPADSSAG